MNYHIFIAILLFIMPFGTSALKPTATSITSTSTVNYQNTMSIDMAFINTRLALGTNAPQNDLPQPTPKQVIPRRFLRSVQTHFFRQQKNVQKAPAYEMTQSLVPTPGAVASHPSAIPSAYLRQDSLAMMARLAKKPHTRIPLQLHRKFDVRVIKFLATVLLGLLFRELPRRGNVQGPRRVRRQPVAPLAITMGLEETPAVQEPVFTVPLASDPVTTDAPMEAPTTMEQMPASHEALDAGSPQEVIPDEEISEENGVEAPEVEAPQQKTNDARAEKEVSFLDDLEKQMLELANEKLLEAPGQDLGRLTYFAQLRYFKQSLQYMKGESNYLKQMRDFTAKAETLLATHAAPYRKWELQRNVTQWRLNYFLKEHINPPLEAAESYEIESEGREGPMDCVRMRLFFHHTSQDRKSWVSGEFVHIMIEIHRLMEASKGREVDEERCLRITNNNN